MPTLTKPSSPSLKTNANLLADRINPLLRKAEPNPLAGVHYQGNTESDSAAGQPGIATSKLNHRQHRVYAQANVTIVTATIPVWLTYGTAGTVLSFKAGSIVACIGAATVTVDLYKNGASILSAPITLNSSSVARVAQAATISTPATAAGDWFDMVVTATVSSGTLGTGLYAEAIIDENPS